MCSAHHCEKTVECYVLLALRPGGVPRVDNLEQKAARRAWQHLLHCGMAVVGGLPAEGFWAAEGSSRAVKKPSVKPAGSCWSMRQHCGALGGADADATKPHNRVMLSCMQFHLKFI